MLAIILTSTSLNIFAQENDTVIIEELKPVLIHDINYRNELGHLSDVKGTYINSGKKNEVISITRSDVCVAEKSARQLFAKVPGVFVYDMEGSNQINIATRGLDPHRAWEMNLRKDGIIINSDMYGYPASHYSIPMEHVEKIEFVRGTGSLQYGAQLGGMLNYLSKKANSSKKFNFESINTIGSYDLLSSYNAIHGGINKVSYYAYTVKRTKDGYRDGEGTEYDAQGINLSFELSKKINVTLDWARSNYIYKIPGPLTDVMFESNPRQASRNRNYYSPTIQIPSIIFDWKLSDNTKLLFTSSAVIGQRKSVIFDRPATIKDTINASTLMNNNRQVDIDNFESYTQEVRILQKYRLLNQNHTIVVGLQYMNNNLHRTQLGKGTTGSNYDLSLVDGQWGRDMFFKTENIAIFTENSFQLTKNFMLNAGARMEIGDSKMSGTIIYYPENNIPVSISRNFPLFGAGFSYKVHSNSEFYGGWTQAYRPMLFKDIIPSSIFEKVDPKIQDAKGYNFEMGYRGRTKSFQWDVTGFVLKYNKRFGTLAMVDDKGEFYTYRTNIGDSRTQGLELFIQYNFNFSGQSRLSVFTSTAIMDGRYTSGSLRAGNVNIDLLGKKIESVPNLISRNGLTFQFKRCSITGLYSHTGKSYADHLNTEMPNATASVGAVPAYSLIDIMFSYKFSESFQLKASINNLSDRSYFTKRPLFYPGPGIWPSDGRNLNITAAISLSPS
jgi:Fe(3+) dicitrate transport protein